MQVNQLLDKLANAYYIADEYLNLKIESLEFSFENPCGYK